MRVIILVSEHILDKRLREIIQIKQDLEIATVGAASIDPTEEVVTQADEFRRAAKLAMQLQKDREDEDLKSIEAEQARREIESWELACY